MSTTYPVDVDEIYSAEFGEWAVEAFEMSKLYVYKGKSRANYLNWPYRSSLCPTSSNSGFDVASIDFTENTDLSQAYIDRGLKKCKKHMMYGAARLAALMVDIYGTSAQAETFLE